MIFTLTTISLFALSLTEVTAIPALRLGHGHNQHQSRNSTSQLDSSSKAQNRHTSTLGPKSSDIARYWNETHPSTTTKQNKDAHFSTRRTATTFLKTTAIPGSTSSGATSGSPDSTLTIEVTSTWYLNNTCYDEPASSSLSDEYESVIQMTYTPDETYTAYTSDDADLSSSDLFIISSSVA